MMEESDEALGFEREIYWLNGQAEKRSTASATPLLSRPTSTGSPAP